MQSLSLEYLSITNIEDGDMDVIQHVLQSLGPSLHSLNLDFGDLRTYYLVTLVFKLIVLSRDSAHVELFDLRSNIHLRYLCISGNDRL